MVNNSKAGKKSFTERSNREREREDESDVRRQMFVLYCTRLSLFVGVHLLSTLSNGRKGFIIYSSEVKAPANPRTFFKKRIKPTENRVMSFEAILMVILWCAAWK